MNADVLRVKWRWTLLCSVVLGCAVWFMQSAPASASPYLPDAANFTPAGAFGDPWLEVSRADGVNVQLNAPVLWVKVYATTPNISLDFDNIAHCGPDYGPPVDTIFRVFRTTPNENLQAPFTTIAQQNTGGASTCAGTTLNINGLVRSSVNGHTDYYVGLVQIIHNGAPGSINRFKIWGNGNELGYWDQGKIEDINTGVITPINDAYTPSDPNSNPLSFFGLGSAFAIQSPSTQPQDMTLEFAPSCDVTTNRVAFLKWYDADQGMPNQRGAIWFTLDEYDSNGNFVGTQINTSAVGGGDAFGAVAFTAVPNHRYRWTWRNVDQSNGIQFWLPYDSQNYYLSCNPPVGALDGNGAVLCSGLNGWVFDRDNLNVHPQIHAYFDRGTPQQRIVALSAQLPNGAVPPPASNRYRVVQRPDVQAAYGLPHNWVGYSIDASYVPQDMLSHTVDIALLGIDVNGNNNGEVVWLPQRSVGPCVTPSCSALSLADQATGDDLGSRPEPGQVFSARFGVTAPTAPPGATGNYSITPQSPPAAPPAASGPVVYNQNGGLAAAVPNITLNNAGVYTFRWVYQWGGGGPGQSQTCTAQIQVANKPYVRIYGNDVGVGGNFDTTAGNCASTPAPLNANATILTYARNVGGSYRGAAVEFAAQALGSIQQFFSSDGGSSPPDPPTDLTFANYNGASPMSGYGGNSAMSTCAPDYYANASAAAAAAGPGSLADGARRYTGPVTIPGGTVSAGAKAALYIDGDVYITGPVQFAAGPYANRNLIPSLFVIARGNIYIASGVSQIDGFFVAQPRAAGTGGTIYTCAVPNGSGGYRAPNSAEVFNGCGGSDNRRLTINGAFIAKKIEFLRANGTLHRGPANEAAASNNIAELFNFTPELYMAIPNSTLASPGSRNSYNSITSLPPIL